MASALNSVLSSKFQVTVPPAVRRSLGLRSGTRVEFILVPGGAWFRRQLPAEDPVALSYGLLRSRIPAGQRVDNLITAMRGPGPRIAKRRRR